MTDAKDSHATISKLWDINAEKMKSAKTIGELCEALSAMFVAIKPLVERVTVTDDEFQQHIRDCPARVLLTGNARPALTALIEKAPILAFIGAVVYLIVRYWPAGG